MKHQHQYQQHQHPQQQQQQQQQYQQQQQQSTHFPSPISCCRLERWRRRAQGCRAALLMLQTLAISTPHLIRVHTAAPVKLEVDSLQIFVPPTPHPIPHPKVARPGFGGGRESQELAPVTRTGHWHFCTHWRSRGSCIRRAFFKTLLLARRFLASPRSMGGALHKSARQIQQKKVYESLGAYW